MAKDWLSRYGGTIHQKRADVLSHFKKDPANLPIRWEQYQSEYLDRFRNAKTRLDNGLAIAPDEQQQLRDNVAAISKSIPTQLSPVAQTKISPLKASDNQLKSDVKKQIISQSILEKTIDPQSGSRLRRARLNPTKTNYSIDLSSIPTNEAKPDNLAAYQYHQPKPIENLADPKNVALSSARFFG